MPTALLRLLVVLLRGDIYNVGSSRDPFLLGQRSIRDDIATGRAVLVVDRLQLRMHVGRAVDRTPLTAKARKGGQEANTRIALRQSRDCGATGGRRYVIAALLVFIVTHG